MTTVNTFAYRKKCVPSSVKTSTSLGQDLMVAWSNIYGMWATFTLTETCQVNVNGMVSCHHRGIGSTANTMAAFKLTLNDETIPNAVFGGNIISTTQHYETWPIWGDIELEPGEYTIRLMGRGETDAAPGVDGILEVKSQFTGMSVQAIPLTYDVGQ